MKKQVAEVLNEWERIAAGHSGYFVPEDKVFPLHLGSGWSSDKSEELRDSIGPQYNVSNVNGYIMVRLLTKKRTLKFKFTIGAERALLLLRNTKVKIGEKDGVRIYAMTGVPPSVTDIKAGRLFNGTEILPFTCYSVPFAACGHGKTYNANTYTRHHKNAHA